MSICEPVITGAKRSVGSDASGEHVADLVDLDHQPEVAHPGHHQVTAVPIGVGQRQPGATTLAVRSGDRSDLPERLDSASQTIGVDPKLGMRVAVRWYDHAATLPTRTVARNTVRSGPVDR